MFKKIQVAGQVFIRDTDATGRIYCPRPIEWVIEAFEKECYKHGHEKESIVIVQAAVHYFSPFAWFDPYKMELEIERVGTRSFDLKGFIYKGEEKAIEVKLVFVVEKSAESFLKKYWAP
jgi:acyl-CoA thioesterase FadM